MYGMVKKMKSYPDISHHHPVVNWDTIKKEYPFIISKATEGTSYIDPTLRSFISNCEKRKIPYWLYTFLLFGNELAQAQFMVRVCKDLVGPSFVGYILDIERGNPQSNCIQALNWLKGQCKRQMIYTNWADYRLGEYHKLVATRPDTCAWWEARYGPNDGQYHASAPCNPGVELYQYTSHGTALGVSDPGHIDMNVITGAKTERWFCGLEEEKEAKKVNIELSVLCRDVKCPEVLAWKKMLTASGYGEGLNDSKRFGATSEKRTKEWQKANGLTADGIVGKKSWTKMLLG